jgi:hypothetical protein
MKDLFGSSLVDLGGTGLELECALCHTVHNQGLTEEGQSSDTTVLFLEIGEARICEDCFPAVEDLVLRLLPAAIEYLEAEASALNEKAATLEDQAINARHALQDHDRSLTRFQSAAPSIEDDVPF